MLQKITAPPLETCPNCGSPVRKLISKNVAIIFKGSGFMPLTIDKGLRRKLNKERQSESQAWPTVMLNPSWPSPTRRMQNWLKACRLEAGDRALPRFHYISNVPVHS